MAKIDELREFFKADLYAMDATGITIDKVDDSTAECSMIIKDCHMNAGGTVQGGAIFTLADFTYAVIANALHPITITQSSSISFLSAGVGEKLIAVAKEIYVKGHNSFGEVTITNDKGKVIAIATMNGFVK